MILDIDATAQGQGPDMNTIQFWAAECRMPLCYGGGITRVDHAMAIVDGIARNFYGRGDSASLVQVSLRTLSMDCAATRCECYRTIEQRYNAHRQIETIRSRLIQ